MEDCVIFVRVFFFGVIENSCVFSGFRVHPVCHGYARDEPEIASCFGFRTLLSARVFYVDLEDANI